MTRQRGAVAAKLLAAGRPLSAYALLDMLRVQDGSATPATIDRGLAFLMKYGIVHQIETTRSFVVCEHPDHPHAVQFLICRQCGVTVQAEDKGIAAAAEKLGHKLGFVLDLRTVERRGLCGSCQASQA